MQHLRLAVLIASLALTPAIAQTSASPVTVSVEGAVDAPGPYSLPARARIGEAVSRAQPNSDAYTLGAALLRKKAYAEQSQLKAGLIYDLQTIQAGKTSAESAVVAATLSQWLQTLPVTGRVVQRLEPHLLAIDRAINPPAADGDRVIYPSRPDYVSVVGAVEQPCRLPHAPAQDVKHYLSACTSRKVADPDIVYVAQPDGQVQTLGIALWNRGKAQTLAPGAILYVPLSQRAVRRIDPDFNREFAEFLATQLLPAPGVTP